MEIVVNADDFGKNENVTRAISECFDRGILTSTTLMVNMPYADRAAALSREKGFDGKVGLHLNLTGGKPLTDQIRALPAFCGGDGRFHGNFHRSARSRLYMDRENTEAVSSELRAQIEKYLDYGFPMKHLDSHHHVHTNLPVLKALEPLIAEFGISSVRISRNLFEGGFLPHRIYKSYYNRRLRRMPIRTTDFFGGYTDFRDYRRLIEENQSVEIMLHPMYGGDGRLMDTDTPMDEVERTLSETAGGNV